jgi:hypothetical protein
MNPRPTPCLAAALVACLCVAPPLRASTPEQETSFIDAYKGKKLKLPLTPIKKLVTKVQVVSPQGSSTSTSESFVAESDGKLVVPVPAPVK